jgi:hypothetical protein
MCCAAFQASYGDMIGCDNPDCPIEWFHDVRPQFAYLLPSVCFTRCMLFAGRQLSAVEHSGGACQPAANLVLADGTWDVARRQLSRRGVAAPLNCL